MIKTIKIYHKIERFQENSGFQKSLKIFKDFKRFQEITVDFKRFHKEFL